MQNSGKRIIDYKMLAISHLPDFTNKIKELIHKGWELYGYSFFADGHLCQPLVKYESKKLDFEKFQVGQWVILTDAIYHRCMIGAIGCIVDPALSHGPTGGLPKGKRYLISFPEYTNQTDGNLFWATEKHLECIIAPQNLCNI